MLSTIAKFKTTLAAAISASATSLILTSANSEDNTAIASGLYGFVIDEGNTNEEYVIGTLSGTTVSTLSRGISYEDGSTEITANKKAHRKGATIKITDHPAIIQIIKILNGTTTVANVLKSSVAPVEGVDLGNKDYIDGVVVAGGADASTSVKGISKLSTAPASATNPIAAGDNDPRLPTADEKAALAGIGAPSATSKFITEIGLAGIVIPYAGTAAPTGFLLCDGAAVSRSTYARLFAIVATTYGAGNGSTTFNLPNLKGKIPVGLNAAETEFDVLGEIGGAKTHTLIAAEMPAHTHDIIAYSSNMGGGTSKAQRTSSDNDTTLVPDSTTSTGGDGAHNNLQPYLVLNYIIKI